MSRRQVVRFTELLADALARGAQLCAGGAVSGRLVRATVLTGVTPAMRIMREETFAPVLPITAFDGDDEAIGLANDSDFGLSASVWTGELERRARIASRLEAGSVAVNDVLFRGDGVGA